MKILTLLLLLFTVTLHAQITGETIKDFAFKNEAQLTAKYGKPIKTVETPEQDVLGFGNYTLEWTIKGQRIVAFYTDATFKNIDFIALYDFKFNADTFYKQFGWDKPYTTLNGNRIDIDGLQGCRSFYNIDTKSLSVVIKDPDITTFGKRK